MIPLPFRKPGHARYVLSSLALALGCAAVHAQGNDNATNQLIVKIADRSSTAGETPMAVMERAAARARVLLRTDTSLERNDAAPIGLSIRALPWMSGTAPGDSDLTPSRDQTFVLTLDKPLPLQAVERIAKALSGEPGIAYAQPDHVLWSSEAAMESPGRFNGRQWAYFHPYGINLERAWQITHGSADTVIAVLDSGYRPHHALERNLVQGFNFVGTPSPDAIDPGVPLGSGCRPWRGTIISGLISSDGKKDDFTGVNLNSRILPVRITDNCRTMESDMLLGMQWAVGEKLQDLPVNRHPARVISLGMTATGACQPAFQDVVRRIGRKASIVVTSGIAGSGVGGNIDEAYPANCPGVITVVGSDVRGNRAFYSNYGNNAALSAPVGTGAGPENAVYGPAQTGKNASDPTDPPLDTYLPLNSSTLAAAQVAGVVGLMLSAQPGMTPPDVKYVLQETAQRFPATSLCVTEGGCGAGIVDAGRAVDMARRWKSR